MATRGLIIKDEIGELVQADHEVMTEEERLLSQYDEDLMKGCDDTCDDGSVLCRNGETVKFNLTSTLRYREGSIDTRGNRNRTLHKSVVVK